MLDFWVYYGLLLFAIGISTFELEGELRISKLCIQSFSIELEAVWVNREFNDLLSITEITYVQGWSE